MPLVDMCGDWIEIILNEVIYDILDERKNEFTNRTCLHLKAQHYNLKTQVVPCLKDKTIVSELPFWQTRRFKVGYVPKCRCIFK